MPLLRTSTKPRINRIDALQKQIKWVEDHSHGNAKADANIKELKTELAELLEEEAKADALRRLPLYSCRITAWHGMKNNDLIRQLKGNVSSESSDGSNHQ